MFAIQGRAGLCSVVCVFAIHSPAGLRIAFVCCNPGSCWPACWFCVFAIPGRAGLRIVFVCLHSRVVLAYVLFLCLQSGPHWSRSAYCFCAFAIQCFSGLRGVVCTAMQGRAGPCVVFVFFRPGLCWFAYCCCTYVGQKCCREVLGMNV